MRGNALWKTSSEPEFSEHMATVVLHKGLGYTFSPNINSLIESLELAIGDGQEVMKKERDKL